MSIIEAIDADLASAQEAVASAQERVNRLQALRDQAAELDGQPAKPPPSDSEAPSDEPPAQRKPAARRTSAKRKSGRKSAPQSTSNGKPGDDRVEQIVSFVAEHPGCRSGELQEALSLSLDGKRRGLKAAIAAERIRTEGQRAGTRYFPAGDVPRPSEAPAQSTAPARVSRSLPDQRAEERKARQDHMAGIELAVIELVKDSEPISVDDVTTILLEQHADWDWEAITSTIKNAKRRNELKTRPDGQLVLASSPITGASEGPKTNTERQVCEAVASIGLTASEISSSIQISERQVRDIAASLVRRGVLTSYGKPDRPVFELAEEKAAA